MLASSTLTLLAFGWLVLPPDTTGSPIPAIASFAIGHGFSPRKASSILSSSELTFLVVLLVVIVPKIVSLKYVSTALGVHKSVSLHSDLPFCLNNYLVHTVGANWLNHIPNLRWYGFRHTLQGPRKRKVERN